MGKILTEHSLYHLEDLSKLLEKAGKAQINWTHWNCWNTGNYRVELSLALKELKVYK